MKPFGKYIVVKEERKEDKKTSSGIIVEIGALQHKDEVTVIAIGDEVTKCGNGDRLLVNKRRFVNDIKDENGNVLHFIHEGDCYCKL